MSGDIEAIGLLQEVMQWHADPASPDYNGCDKDRCLWCEQAAKALTSLRDKQKKEDALRAETPPTSEQPNEETGLLPCPFCGGEASANGEVKFSDNHEAWWADGTRIVKGFFCNCLKCQISNKGLGGHQTREKAVAQWNRRASGNARDTTKEEV